MPDLLLELRSEEIPARMQRKAAGDLRKMVTDGLVEAGLTYEGAREYFTPRRLALDIRGIAARSQDVREEIKGPPVSAPEQAIQGFLRKTGLASVDLLSVRTDPKKGDFYVAVVEKAGRAAEDIVGDIMPGIIRNFPWPKSMRWGAASARPGSLRWVRPLQSILCTFGPETEEPVVVDFEVDGIRSGNVTWGHRFHAPEPITVRRFDDYVSKLEAARVVLDAERRKDIILHDARDRAFALGLELVEDEGLLEEVAGLVEWPVVLMGEFEAEFLDIPAEIIRLTIRANQKCFVTRPTDPSSGPSGHLLPQGVKGERGGAAGVPSPLVGSEGRAETSGSAPIGVSARSAETGEGYRLSNRFVVTANIEASDGGEEIARGNGKVVRARLSDAVHFWKTDQADLPDLERLEPSARKLGLDLNKPLDQRMARLDHLGVTFHAKLGTQGERVERIARLAEEIAAIVGADPALARRAALLAKADLQTAVVGEFPELQGQMGRTYAALQGEHPSVAAAIEDHYRPQGPTDRVPTDPVAIAVALADKLDTLTGFWAIDEKPTGSKDPYALRRAALGVVRILVENGVSAGLGDAIVRHCLEWLSRIDFNLINEPLPAFLGSVLNSELKERLFIAQSMGFASGFILPESPRVREIASLDDMGTSPEEPKEDWIIRTESLVEWAGKVYVVRDDGRSAEFLMHIEELGQPLKRRTLELVQDLLSFFQDRLKVYLRDKGARHDLIDAVLAGGVHPSSAPSGHLLPQGEKEGGAAEKEESTGGREGRGGAAGSPSPLVGEGGSRSEPGEGSSSNDDLLLIVRRVEALTGLLDTEDGKNLLAGTRRAANILGIEEKKGTRIAEAVNPSLFADAAETKLFEAVNRAESEAGQAIRNQDFSAAMRALAALREPVDSFFEAVLVNDEDEAVRANRLALLARIRAATGQVADFSKIAG